MNALKNESTSRRSKQRPKENNDFLALNDTPNARRPCLYTYTDEIQIVLNNGNNSGRFAD